MNQKNIILSALVVSALAMVGCGDDSGLGSAPKSTTALSTAEQKALSDTISETLNKSSGIPSLTGKIAKSLAPYLHSKTASEDVNETITCGGGGSVVVAGTVKNTVDEEAQTYKGTWDIGTTYKDCKEDAEESVITLNGDLKSKGNFDYAITGTTAEDYSFTAGYTGETVGGVDVTGAKAGNGTCGVDIKTVLAFSKDKGTVTVTGNVCGTDVSESQSFPDDSTAKIASK